MISLNERAILFPRDPEPCDDCDTGLSYMICFDGLRRCYSCVHDLANRNGWDEMPPPPDPDPEPIPSGPDMPLSPAERKVIREEKKALKANLPQMVFALDAPPTE